MSSRSTTARHPRFRNAKPSQASAGIWTEEAIIHGSGCDCAVDDSRVVVAVLLLGGCRGCGRPLEERRAGQACPRVPAVERRAPRETRFTTPSSSRTLCTTLHTHFTKWPPFCFCSHFSKAAFLWWNSQKVIFGIYIVILVQSLKEPISDLVNGWRLHGVGASGAATKHNEPVGLTHGIVMTWKGSAARLRVRLLFCPFLSFAARFQLRPRSALACHVERKKNLLLFQFFRRSVRRGETAIPNWRFGTQSQIRMCALASRNEGEERDDDFQAGCSVLGCLVPLLIHWR